MRDRSGRSVRIIAGRHRGRRIDVPAGVRIRPTAARAREALFNILVHGGLGEGGTSPLPGARVLDAFAGSGALGLEALSRGAGHAVFMDAERAALETVRRNAARLGEEARVSLVAADAAHPPRAAGPACAVVFLDPPYGSGIGPAALAALAGAGWIAPRAVCVLEYGAREPEPAPPEGFAPLDARAYGAARLLLLRFRG